MDVGESLQSMPNCPAYLATLCRTPQMLPFVAICFRRARLGACQLSAVLKGTCCCQLDDRLVSFTATAPVVCLLYGVEYTPRRRPTGPPGSLAHCNIDEGCRSGFGGDVVRTACETARQGFTGIRRRRGAVSDTSGDWSSFRVRTVVITVLFVLQHECWITQSLPRTTVHII